MIFDYFVCLWCWCFVWIGIFIFGYCIDEVDYVFFCIVCYFWDGDLLMVE